MESKLTVVGTVQAGGGIDLGREAAIQTGCEHPTCWPGPVFTKYSDWVCGLPRESYPSGTWCWCSWSGSVMLKPPVLAVAVKVGMPRVVPASVPEPSDTTIFDVPPAVAELKVMASEGVGADDDPEPRGR